MHLQGQGALVIYDRILSVVNSPRKFLAVLVGNTVASSWTYSLLEDKGPIEGLWWGIVTGSTVGYGDFYPESTAGRGVGAWLIVTTIIAVAIGTAQLSSKLIVDHDAFTHEEQEELKKLLRRAVTVVGDLSSEDVECICDSEHLNAAGCQCGSAQRAEYLRALHNTEGTTV